MTAMTKRITELDGLRGFAALIVVIAHYFGEAPGGIAHLQMGWLGVNIFFVLSGFLIGGIILDQSGDPGFFKSFYFRRVTRIFPVYFLVVLLALWAAHMTEGHTWSDHPYTGAYYATFTVNFAAAIHGIGSLWLRPTWTLSVEEQFYLLLPPLIIFTPRRYLMPLLAALWVSALALRVVLGHFNPLMPEVLLPCRMDLLLAGVMLAWVYRNLDLSRFLTQMRVTWGVCIAALDLIALTGHLPLMVLIAGSVTSIAVSCYMLAAFYGAPEGRWVRAGWLRWFGQISYCLYLVHQPVNGLLHGLLLNADDNVATLPAFAVSILAMGVSIGIATLSWHWLEQPILKWASAENRKFMVAAAA